MTVRAPEALTRRSAPWNNGRASSQPSQDESGSRIHALLQSAQQERNSSANDEAASTSGGYGVCFSKEPLKGEGESCQTVQRKNQ